MAFDANAWIHERRILLDDDVLDDDDADLARSRAVARLWSEVHAGDPFARAPSAAATVQPGVTIEVRPAVAEQPQGRR
jgi:hypothetical protein